MEEQEGQDPGSFPDIPDHLSPPLQKSLQWIKDQIWDWLIPELKTSFIRNNPFARMTLPKSTVSTSSSRYSRKLQKTEHILDMTNIFLCLALHGRDALENQAYWEHLYSRFGEFIDECPRGPCPDNGLAEYCKMLQERENAKKQETPEEPCSAEAMQERMRQILTRHKAARNRLVPSPSPSPTADRSAALLPTEQQTPALPPPVPGSATRQKTQATGPSRHPSLPAFKFDFSTIKKEPPSQIFMGLTKFIEKRASERDLNQGQEPAAHHPAPTRIPQLARAVHSTQCDASLYRELPVREEAQRPVSSAASAQSLQPTREQHKSNYHSHPDLRDDNPNPKSNPFNMPFFGEEPTSASKKSAKTAKQSQQTPLRSQESQQLEHRKRPRPTNDGTSPTRKRDRQDNTRTSLSKTTPSTFIVAATPAVAISAENQQKDTDSNTTQRESIACIESFTDRVQTLEQSVEAIKTVQTSLNTHCNKTQTAADDNATQVKEMAELGNKLDGLKSELNNMQATIDNQVVNTVNQVGATARILIAEELQAIRRDILQSALPTAPQKRSVVEVVQESVSQGISAADLVKVVDAVVDTMPHEMKSNLVSSLILYMPPEESQKLLAQMLGVSTEQLIGMTDQLEQVIAQNTLDLGDGISTSHGGNGSEEFSDRE